MTRSNLWMPSRRPRNARQLLFGYCPRLFWILAFVGLLVETSPACSDGIGARHAAGSSSKPVVATHPSPIKHVVVVVKENHTFDNYFGTFPGAEGTTRCLTTKGVIPATRAPNVTPRDLAHGHSEALADWNGGAMDGWLAVSGASDDGDNLFCAQYLEEDLPGYWAYARAYGLADHFFANSLGPSFPSHAFLIAAQAAWALDNPSGKPAFPYWGCDEAANDEVEVLESGSCAKSFMRPCFDIPSVPSLLPHGVDWRFYGTTFGDHDEVWLVDEDSNDEHPGAAGVCEGENWTTEHLNPLMQSSLWDSSVVLFTMDDFGGWYDHVRPPRQYGCNTTQPYGLGFRLPLIVMSSYVKRGVYKGVAEQASIVRFILEIFNATAYLWDLDPAAQDGQANDLMDMFDWNQKPLDPLVVPPRTCSMLPAP